MFCPKTLAWTDIRQQWPPNRSNEESHSHDTLANRRHEPPIRVVDQYPKEEPYGRSGEKGLHLRIQTVRRPIRRQLSVALHIEDSNLARYARLSDETTIPPNERGLAEPVDAAVFHGGGGVEALGDGLGDDRLPLLRQPIQQRPLLLDQPVDLGRLLIQKGRDALLGFEGWSRIPKAAYSRSDTLETCDSCQSFRVPREIIQRVDKIHSRGCIAVTGLDHAHFVGLSGQICGRRQRGRITSSKKHFSGTEH